VTLLKRWTATAGLVHMFFDGGRSQAEGDASRMGKEGEHAAARDTVPRCFENIGDCKIRPRMRSLYQGGLGDLVVPVSIRSVLQTSPEESSGRR
jgi:hypothetical protein